MTVEDDLPHGVLIKTEQTKERCGNCKKSFTLETYFDPLTDKRSYRVLCITCNYAVPTGDDY